MGAYSEYGSAARCYRSVLVFGNIFFAVLGCAVIGVGIYLLVERIYFVQWVYGTQLAVVSCYLIMAAGCLMFLISLIGCFGTLFKNKRLLCIYCFVLSVIFMLSVIGATIGIVCRVWIAGLVRVYMRESLLSTYGTNMQSDWNNLVTRSWDEIQEKLQCCAVEDKSWYLYRETFWYKDHPGHQEVDKPYVPASCCKRDGRGLYVDQFKCQMYLRGPPGRQGGAVNNALHYRGCFEAGKDVLYPIVAYFAAIGFFMAAIVIVGIICSLQLYIKL